MTEIEIAKFELEELEKLTKELRAAENHCRELGEKVKARSSRIWRAKNRVIDRIWRVKNKIVKIATDH